MNPSQMKAPKENGTLILQYLKGSKQMMGISLWNVLSPKVEGYVYGPNTGVPTFSLDTLKSKGLIKWF